MVRVRIANSEGKSPTELLATVKPVIQGAYAVRPLRSGDIEVAVLDQKAKDQALNQQEAEGCKVLHQDYPVEVPGVPLALEITNKKSATNDAVIKEICLANKCVIPSIAVSKIRWLHDDKMQAERIRNGKTRGTVIISLPTQAIQHEVVRRGIVIESQLYDTRLYFQGLEDYLVLDRLGG